MGDNVVGPVLVTGAHRADQAHQAEELLLDLLGEQLPLRLVQPDPYGAAAVRRPLPDDLHEEFEPRAVHPHPQRLHVERVPGARDLGRSRLFPGVLVGVLVGVPERVGHGPPLLAEAPSVPAGPAGSARIRLPWAGVGAPPAPFGFRRYRTPYGGCTGRSAVPPPPAPDTAPVPSPARHWPTLPSTHSRSRSAWPQCRAYSSIRCTSSSRTAIRRSPTRSPGSGWAASAASVAACSRSRSA